MLGSVLLTRKVLAGVRAVVAPADFYHPAHRAIFEAVCAVDDAGELGETPAEQAVRDDGAIAREMDRAGTMKELRALEGVAYFSTLFSTVIVTDLAPRDAQRVADLAHARRVMERAVELVKAAREGRPPDELRAVAVAIVDLATPATPGGAVAHDSDPDIGAAYLARLRGAGPPLVFDRERLWRYEARGGVWRPLDADEEHRGVQALNGELVAGRQLLLREPRIAGALRAAHAQAAQPAFFDGAPAGIAFANGFLVVDADGVRLAPHAPDHRATAALPCDYDDNAPRERFGRFLQEVFAPDEDRGAKMLLLSQFVGACLVGAAVRFQRALMLPGFGANGKSTFLEIVQAIFPRTSIVAISPHKFEEDYFRAMLDGARLNIVSETSGAEILASEGFKAITSGDLITARSVFQRPVTFRPVAGHVFAANALPPVNDSSPGFWRRWLVVRFAREFPPEAAERDLGARIVRDELPGVAAWAIEGAAMLLSRGGYFEPPSSAHELAQWRSDADQVCAYATERLRKVDEPVTKGDPLYQDYNAWARRNGFGALNSRKFAGRLQAVLRVKPVHRNTGSFWPVEIVLAA